MGKRSKKERLLSPGSFPVATVAFIVSYDAMFAPPLRCVLFIPDTQGGPFCQFVPFSTLLFSDIFPRPLPTR